MKDHDLLVFLKSMSALIEIEIETLKRKQILIREFSSQLLD